jgi:hypothetical protein
VNYVADTSGFKIAGDGNAEFNSVKVRGTLYASTLETGNILTVKGTIQSNGYNGTNGWYLNVSGEGKFLNNIETYYLYLKDINTSTRGWLYTPDGVKLWWVDKNSLLTQIVP